MSPENVLVDTLARLQQDLADIRAESRLLRTPVVQPVVQAPRQAPRQAAFTTKCHGLERQPVGSSTGKLLTP